jgi:hypothetical protein
MLCGELATRIMCGAAVCSGLCAAQTVGKQPRPNAQQTTVKQVLSWLPVDTETVIAATGPSLADVEASPADDFDQKPSSRDWEKQMEALPLYLLQFKNGGLLQAIKDRKVTIAVEGSRHFRPPAVLGAMRYEGCAIVVFADNLAALRAAFMKSAASSATRFETVDGLPVAVFREESENDIWTTFVAFAKGNIVAVATDMSYLRTVLMRMNSAAGSRALPETLPEWKDLDTRSRFWGVRHYDKIQAKLDPTSPFQGPAPANFPDPAAVGVAFSLEPGDHTSIDVTYLSGMKDARQVLQRWFMIDDPPPGLEVHLRQAGPGTVRCLLSVSDAEIGLGLVVVVSIMLGHAVYF